MPESLSNRSSNFGNHRRILVAESEEGTSLSDALKRKLGCEVLTVATVGDAISKYETGRVDMIVLADYAESGGAKIAKALSSRNCDVPVLIYSLNVITKNDLRGLNLVVDAVLKPDQGSLVSIISTVMGWPVHPE